MTRKKQKRIVSGEERAIRFNLFHNGLFKQKVIPNKKKKNDRKDWKCKKETYYQKLSEMVIFGNRFLKTSYELKSITLSMNQL